MNTKKYEKIATIQMKKLYETIVNNFKKKPKQSKANNKK